MFKAMKFRINNKVHSARVQIILFSLGYKWSNKYNSMDTEHTDKPYLYADWMGYLKFGQYNDVFNSSLEEEIDVSWLDTQDYETIEIEGVTYRKIDVMERLKELESVK